MIKLIRKNEKTRQVKVFFINQKSKKIFDKIKKKNLRYFQITKLIIHTECLRTNNLIYEMTNFFSGMGLNRP